MKPDSKQATPTRDLLSKCWLTFGKAERLQHSKRWLNRAEADPAKLERIVDQTEQALRARRIRTSAARYAEFLWRLPA